MGDDEFDHDPALGAGTAASVAEEPDRRGGGTGIAGGTDLHAMAMVVAAAHLLRGTSIGWLADVTEDVPIAIRAETGGPGDDIALDLENGGKVEVQSKKNLRKGSELWEALEALIDGIQRETIDHGVLAVAPDSSGTIRIGLAADLVKIGQDIEDTLTALGEEWLDRLKSSGRPLTTCANVRIVTLHLLEADGADRRMAIEVLRSACAEPDQAEEALECLYRHAIALMKTRGRWALPSLISLLRARRIVLRDDEAPAGIATRLVQWVESTRRTFSLPAGSSGLPIEAMLPVRLVAVSRDEPPGPDALAALHRYHARQGTKSDGATFDGQWVGRFRPLNVIVAGPGLGKSTLAQRLALEYARDGIPVLVAPLRRVAVAMQAGSPFDRALADHALDGTGLDLHRLERARLRHFVVIADGLDEAGDLHEDIGRGLAGYAAGHGEATIIVTTRPIGYETAHLADWRHYRIEPPDTKDGERNLARLIAAGRGIEIDDAGILELAKRELASTPARDAIVASPLLLAMAATLLIRDEHLAATRPGLYEAMIALFEKRDTTPSSGRVTGAEAARILDIVGWELTHNPLMTWGDLERVARRRLAADLGSTALAASPLFERGFSHWERAGIVERLHHAGAQLVTFVHQAFGEFAAARYLMDIDPGRREEMERLVDAPAMGEVVSFAGGLGLGNDLAQLYVERRDRGGEGQFERALALSGDPDARVDEVKAAELAEIAFGIVATDAADRFSIGSALADLAKARAGVVATALARLDDRSDAVRLVAWACAIAAGPEHYDISRLDDVFADLVQRIEPPESVTRRAFGAGVRGKDVGLIQSIALATLEAKSKGEMADFVERRLSAPSFTNVGFQIKVEAVLAANGLERAMFASQLSGSPISTTARVVQDNSWRRAANQAMRALAEAVVGDGGVVEGASPRPRRPYLNFSALYRLVDFESTEAADVFKWTAPYDGEAVREAVGALVSLSSIDSAELAGEAREIIARLDAEPDQRSFFLELGQPDIPDPNWTEASSLGLNRDRLENALLHGSSWLMLVAANLLANMPATATDCARLLAKSHGRALFYASKIATSFVGPEQWRDLVMHRLEAGPESGTEHLLRALTESSATLTPTTAGAVERALLSEEVDVVEAAAGLGNRLVAEGGGIDASVAKAAYRRSLERDEGLNLVRRPPGDARAAVLRMLAADGSLDDELLGLALADPRPEPRKVASEVASRRGAQAAN